MEMKLVSKDKNSIKIMLPGIDENMLFGLTQELLNDDKVIKAECKTGHPTIETPTLYVEVSEGKPQTALKRAAKSIGNQFKEFRELVERESKK